MVPRSRRKFSISGQPLPYLLVLSLQEEKRLFLQFCGTLIAWQCRGPYQFFTTYLVAADEDNLVTGSSPTTNASGIATVTIADTVGNGGEVVINAADVNDEILSNDATVTFQAESASFALSADVSLPVVSAGCLCRGNHDDFCHSSFGSGGLPAAGQLVTFSTTGTANLTAPSGNTDSNGVVTVGITDTLSNAGRVVVTVKNGSHEVNIPIYFGADIQLNPATSNSIADGTVVAPLTATVIDASRAVVVGVPVHFSVTAGEAILNVSEVLTDTFGKATVQVTDSIIENAVVHATAGDLAGDSATISFLAGAPANLLLTSAPVNTTPLIIWGRDSYGNGYRCPRQQC